MLNKEEQLFVCELVFRQKKVILDYVLERQNEHIKVEYDQSQNKNLKTENVGRENVEKIFMEFLRRTISIRDTAVRADMKENLPIGKATTKDSKGQPQVFVFIKEFCLVY